MERSEEREKKRKDQNVNRDEKMRFNKGSQIKRRDEHLSNRMRAVIERNG